LKLYRKLIKADPVMIGLLRARRSVRIYEKKTLDEKTVALIAEAIIRAPSSRGICPWSFIFVDDPSTLSALAKAKEQGSSFISGAPFAIVVCGDETKSDVWIEDCSIVALIAHLTAASLGLGSCWIQVRNRLHTKDVTAEQYIQELLKIPPHLRVVAMVSMGYPAEFPRSIGEGNLPKGKIMKNCYSEGS
jgi:nitroreductase